MITYGLFVSKPNIDVLKAKDIDFSFSADLNIFKIKHEQFAQRSQVIGFDHGLGYMPFFLPYGYSGASTKIVSIGGGTAVVSNWDADSNGYMFLAYNKGIE